MGEQKNSLLTASKRESQGGANLLHTSWTQPGDATPDTHLPDGHGISQDMTGCCLSGRQIGRGEYRGGSVVRPYHSVLPFTELAASLRVRFIIPSVALLQLLHSQTLQVFLKRLANED